MTTASDLCKWLDIEAENSARPLAAIFLKDAANYIRAQEARISEPVAWVTVKDGVCIYTRSANFKHVSDGQHQLYTCPLNDVDADIEYWRQKYLKLDAMYDELEKEKIAIEQNLIDRT